jgi:hypothetical protein
MTAIPLPSFYSRDNLPRVLESTLAYDQWDDWIPDPIYFKDVSERADDFVTELAQQSEITLDGTYSLPVYSESTLKFHTAVVPLSARVLLNGLIASQGEVTRRVLNADRLSGFEYLPPLRTKVPGWVGDLFGAVYGKAEDPPTPGPRGPFGVYAPYTRTRNAPLFTAAGEGLSEALAGAGVWLATRRTSVRSAVWADVQAFFPSINRNTLWKVLERAGAAPGFSACLEAVSRQMGGPGLRPIDDAWTFLATFYLTPVDEALDKLDGSWQRCGDEYLLLADDTGSRSKMLALLSNELAKMGLKLNPVKTATIEINASDPPAEKALLFDGFRLHLDIESSSATWKVTSPSSWPDMLRTILPADASSPRHNAVMLLLRSIHVAREADALNLHRGGQVTDVRAKRYVNTIAGLEWLPKQTTAALRRAVADKHWWTCYWLLLLISDLGDRAAVALDTLAQIASNSTADPTLAAHATLALSKVGNEGDVRTLLAGAKSTGTVIGDRALLAAAFFAEKRWRRNSFDTWKSRADTRLFNYLSRRLRGATS